MINSQLIRYALVIIFILHSVPGMFDNGVNNFGNLYLNKVGFAPFGVALAWIIKISHIAFAIALVLQKYIKPLAIAQILILIAGIWMVHLPEGWFVVGGGRNGVEYNFLLIVIIVSLLFPNGLLKKKE